MTSAPAIEATGLVKRFGAYTAVNSVSFNVPRGSFFSILGPSGCGKTTLMRMLAGFEQPDSGQILLDGVAIADNLFVQVANSNYEVARVPVADGVHVFDGGEEPFSVVIVGYDSYDSYAYLGGTGTGIINPDPQ